jgi:hypothetical protein
MISSPQPASHNPYRVPAQMRHMVRGPPIEERDRHGEDLEGHDQDQERAGVAGEAFLPFGWEEPETDPRTGEEYVLAAFFGIELGSRR